MKPIRTIALAAAAAVLFALALGVTAWAASYDGGWDVVGVAQSARCPGYNMHLDVKGNTITGTTGTVKFTYQLRATIAPDGSFQGQSPGGAARITGKFAGDSVTVQFSNDVCAAPRQGTGKRSG
jgi:hypothetical protein